MLKKDPALSHRLKSMPGVRVPGAWDSFELAVRTILGQQVSVAGASTTSGRLAGALGDPVSVDDPGGNFVPERVFPTPERLVNAALEELGIIRSRANAIRDLSRAVLDGRISFDSSQEPATFVADLMTIRGIGEWTARYLSMRALRNPDAFPSTDLGLQKSLDPDRRMSAKELETLAEHWRPWRAYAAMLLWQAPQSSGG